MKEQEDGPGNALMISTSDTGAQNKPGNGPSEAGEVSTSVDFEQSARFKQIVDQIRNSESSAKFI